MAPLIAVVNDDPTFLELMRDLLEDEGYRANTYEVAQHAYAALQADPPALIVVDIRMETPEAGWHLIERLRRDPELCDTPIIACSADRPFLRSRAESLLEYGCDILEKPFDLEDLLVRVADTLDGATVRGK